MGRFRKKEGNRRRLPFCEVLEWKAGQWVPVPTFAFSTASLIVAWSSSVSKTDTAASDDCGAGRIRR